MGVLRTYNNKIFYTKRKYIFYNYLILCYNLHGKAALCVVVEEYYLDSIKRDRTLAMVAPKGSRPE